jgi:AcrR family transcriptional regulator
MTQSLSDTLFANCEDERRARILDGAMGCFLAYGYQRTTMDDIAKAAEISRPALYLQFRNKTDIYRALATAFMQHAVSNAETVFSGPGDLERKLTSALTCVMDLVGEVEASPHGAEILDMKTSLAAEIVATGRARMIELVETAIAASGPTPLPPRLYADMLLDALDGMKLRMPPVDEQMRLKDGYIAVLMAAMRGG